MRAILFDAMGTLVRLREPASALRAELAARCGVQVSVGQAKAALTAEIAFYRRHLHEGGDPAALADLRARCAAVLADALPGHLGLAGADVHDALLSALRFEAFEDAPAALEGLRARGCRIVVVSNWDCSLPDALAQAGLARSCDAVVSSAAFGAAKPDSAIFAHALALAAVSAAQAIHVGDSMAEDVAGARAAGIEPVLVARDRIPAPCGVRVIRSLAQLLDP